MSSGRPIVVSSYRDAKNQIDAVCASGRLGLPYEGVLLVGRSDRAEVWAYRAAPVAVRTVMAAQRYDWPVTVMWMPTEVAFPNIGSIVGRA
jgi:hypothetical protein